MGLGSHQPLITSSSTDQYITSFFGRFSSVHASTGGRQLEALCVEPAWTLPHEPLPLADLNICPFSIINHNPEYSSFAEFSESFWEIIELEAGPGLPQT